MTTQQVQECIRQLPDQEIWPLLKWLWLYYDNEAWDRLVGAMLPLESPKPNPDELMDMENLCRGSEWCGKKRAACCRRLKAAIESAVGIDRAQCLQDLHYIAR